MIDFDEATHTYWYDGIEVPSVSKVLREAGLQGDISFLDPKYLKRGTAVHGYAEDIDKGCLNYDAIIPEYMPFVAAYEWFKDEHSVLWEGVEEKRFSKKYLFAGTIDRFGYLDKVSAVVDLKTGFYAKWHQVQTAAYRLLLEGEFKAEANYDIYLTSDGLYKIKLNDKPRQGEIFLSALDTYWYKHEMDHRRLIKAVNR